MLAATPPTTPTPPSYDFPQGQPPGRKSAARHSILPAGGCPLALVARPARTLRRLGLTPAQARAKGFATLWTSASPLALASSLCALSSRKGVSRIRLSLQIHSRTITHAINMGAVKTNIILIDFENVQPKDLASLQGKPFQIKVFCGANQSKIPFDLADQLQRLGPDAEYIRIQGTGRNALDFHIAYYIGEISAQTPGATFNIISKDKGFEPLIKYLATNKKITCHLLPSIAGLPASTPAPKPPATDRTQKVADGLLSRKEARPRKLKTLTAFIKGQLNNQATETAVAEVIARLNQAGMSTGAEGNLTWPST